MADISLPPTEPWKVVDLFSGCGGMSSGFRRQRGYFRIIGAVDCEVAKPGRGKHKASSTRCNATYLRNIGIEPKNADLMQLNPTEYRQALGLEKEELDVLLACPPCTGFSQKNSKNHIEDDPRNRLVQRTADFVTEFLPEFFVMENVKELLQGKQRHHFVALCDRLESLSYSIFSAVHDLSEYGLPQRRDRALVLARRNGALDKLNLTSVQKKRTVRDVIGHLPPLEARQSHPSDLMHISPGVTPAVLERIRAIPKNGGSWGDVMKNPQLTEEEKRQLLTPAMFRARPGSFPDVYGRLKWDEPAATITRECGHVGNGRYTHPEQDRLLTVREMALLQGFPKDYIFEGSMAAKYNQIGDAVPPLIAEQIAWYVIQAKMQQFIQHTYQVGAEDRTHQLSLQLAL